MTFENETDHEAAVPEGDDRTAEIHRQLNRVFSGLADHHRRVVLSYLVKGDNDTATVGELLDYIVTRNAESPTDYDEENLKVQLHHNHLPQLDAVGFVDYDVRSKTARYRGHPLLEDYLALADEHVQQTDDP